MSAQPEKERASTARSLTTMPGVSMSGAGDRIVVGVAQISPVWLDRDATVEKVAARVREAAGFGADLVVFGEGLVPGYPFWVELTDGARFDDARQKTMFSHYLDQGVVLERGDLAPVQEACREASIAAYVGTIERAPDRGGHSLYCTLVHVSAGGQIASAPSQAAAHLRGASRLVPRRRSRAARP